MSDADLAGVSPCLTDHLYLAALQNYPPLGEIVRAHACVRQSVMHLARSLSSKESQDTASAKAALSAALLRVSPSFESVLPQMPNGVQDDMVRAQREFQRKQGVFLN